MPASAMGRLLVVSEYLMLSPLRIGTRGSPLALWQANFVADRLRAAAPDRDVVLVEIETAGDLLREKPLSQIGGEGIFTKAIQQALQAGSVDVAVHSLKDLPTFSVAGLVLAAVPRRGPAGDAFISHKHHSFADLPSEAKIGTSSLRRRAQLLHRRPDLQIVDLRGNIETRLRKLKEQDLDAVILAEAGLERLGRTSEVTEILDPAWMLPAVGQGALGLECRADDAATRALLARLDDPPTHQAVLAEREFLRTLGGGCLVPIGAFTSIAAARLTLRGAVLPPDGSRRIAGELVGPLDEAEVLGMRLGQELLSKGARELLQRPA
jgi:hydroxymethylbilane synthase